MHVVFGSCPEEKCYNRSQKTPQCYQAYPELIVANDVEQNPNNEDLNIHFGMKEKGKPWFDSEATPVNTPNGYWGKYSKETHQKTKKKYYNYSRIGRYTKEMKESQLKYTRSGIENEAGYVMASTWIQCGPDEGIGGPFTEPGGYSNLGANADENATWNTDIDSVHPDAGILWWLEFVRDNYGSNSDAEPIAAVADPTTYCQEVNGKLAIEAE